MDEFNFYDSRYFNTNKMMLKVVGLWPNQNAIFKIAVKIFFIIILLISFVPQYISLKQYLGVNPDRVIQALGSIVILLAIFLKFLKAAVNESKLKTVYENIVDNFKLIKNQTEKDVLLRHSEIGRYFTIGYVAYMYLTLVIFMIIPLIPIIMDHVIPINETRTRIYLTDGEYGVDKSEHYGKIYVLEGLCCIILIGTVAPVDSTYVVCVEQCIGLMAVVKLRLQLATRCSNIDSELMHEDNNDSYSAMVDCIKLHKKALNFGQILEETYAMYFLIILGTSVLGLSCISVVVIMKLHQPMELFRFASVMSAVFIQMFYLSWPGEKLIAMSNQLYENTYANEWYQLPMETRKLLIFMMMKTKEPFVLTAGGLYIMNLENFGSLTRATLSYITVFSSFTEES